MRMNRCASAPAPRQRADGGVAIASGARSNSLSEHCNAHIAAEGSWSVTGRLKHRYQAIRQSLCVDARGTSSRHRVQLRATSRCRAGTASRADRSPQGRASMLAAGPHLLPFLRHQFIDR